MERNIRLAVAWRMRFLIKRYSPSRYTLLNLYTNTLGDICRDAWAHPEQYA